MNNDTKIEALYFHWVSHIDSKQYANKFASTSKESNNEVTKFFQLHIYFNRLIISHALLYVVIEGYIKLSLCDYEIDAILSEHGYVDNLRRLRNALFHYQNDIHPPKLMKFIESEDSGVWINRLDKSFENFFIENVPILKATKDIFQEMYNRNND
ncbi:TPA: hypothetical protein I8672_003335 [Legionella pneumophila]|nr:hypothetical protein [Legionella pneumophila]